MSTLSRKISWSIAAAVAFVLCYSCALGAAVGAACEVPYGFSSEPTPSGFGFEDFDVSLQARAKEKINGGPFIDYVPTQAGSHLINFLSAPYPFGKPGDLTIYLHFKSEPEKIVGGEGRNVAVNLPPGFIGNPGATVQCTRQELDGEGEHGEGHCPASSIVGSVTAGVEPSVGFPNGSVVFHNVPIYNMAPPPGMPGQLGLYLKGSEVFIDTKVRSGSNYGITAETVNIPISTVFAEVTIESEPTGASGPFLTLPTSCEGPQEFSAEASTWEEPNRVARAGMLLHDEANSPAGFTGCGRLNFRPSITAAPDTSRADSPAGLTVDVRAPAAGGLMESTGLSMSDIKGTIVNLPQGIAINPGQAAGLAACSNSGIGTEGPPSCPAASRVGTVKVRSPLLETAAEKELEGDVYVLPSDPPHLQLLIAASGDGINLKLIANVTLNESTGQLTTTITTGIPGFEHIPQFPVSEFQLSFSGGAQAALVTPSTCGTYTTSSVFTPWSTPYIPDQFPSSNFAITEDAEGGPCPSSPLPFSPSMIAGATTDQAGGYTDFSLLLQRGDDQQRVSSLQFQLPPGLLGMIGNVPLCGEPQASEGKCSSASQIGHTVIASGPGPYPLIVPEPGQPEAPIYLTGPYKGAPFGMSVVVPVIAGPFNLGTEVVRARIDVNPRTAQVIVTTDPLPQMIKGVPTDLRTVNAVIDRSGFIFNPTNCSPMSFSGTATSVEGTTAPIESRFQVGSCQSLKFTPKFALSTSGKTSRLAGASLQAKLTYPSTPPGANQATSQANLARIKIELPKQLPSRLTTLRKACTGAVFNANPASCPSASVVGHATAVVPVLPVPLSGPVYFVSHGGEAFPSLVIVLQGDNVTADVEASTFISKKETTSLTFKAVPDVPVSSFELVSPEGPYSALTTDGNLCKSTLEMPTEFVAQNGAEIHQNTKIAVTGCPKKAKAKKKSKGKGKKVAIGHRRKSK
jgi:hypothetical protein